MADCATGDKRSSTPGTAMAQFRYMRPVGCGDLKDDEECPSASVTTNNRACSFGHLRSVPQSARENRTTICSLTCGLLAENVPLEEQVSSASRLPRQKKFRALPDDWEICFAINNGILCKSYLNIPSLWIIVI